MKNTIALLLLLFALTAHTQILPEMNPEIGWMIDRNMADEEIFQQQLDECKKIEDKFHDYKSYEALSKAERNFYENCSEQTNYWAVLDIGCSWYCGGDADSLSATSILESIENTTYSAENIHDLSYETAWVEGVEGYGIGESITYHFVPENPRITKVIIANGYIKTEELWRENSRVKKLKMYVNNRPFAMLNLEDTRAEQSFTFEPVGNADRADMEALKALPKWTIRFEIVEVYMGDKYDDTAITEIYFDGIDVH